MRLLSPVAIAACLVAAPWSVGQAGTVYKCVDASGKVFYADRACPQDQTQDLIEVQPAAPPPGASGEEEADSMHEVLDEFREEREALEEERRQEKAERREARMLKCEELRERLARLDGVHCDASGECTVYALVDTDEQGNQVVLPESAKREEIARLKAEIAKDCS